VETIINSLLPIIITFFIGAIIGFLFAARQLKKKTDKKNSTTSSNTMYDNNIQQDKIIEYLNATSNLVQAINKTNNDLQSTLYENINTLIPNEQQRQAFLMNTQDLNKSSLLSQETKPQDYEIPKDYDSSSNKKTTL